MFRTAIGKSTQDCQLSNVSTCVSKVNQYTLASFPKTTHRIYFPPVITSVSQGDQHQNQSGSVARGYLTCMSLRYKSSAT